MIRKKTYSLVPKQYSNPLKDGAVSRRSWMKTVALLGVSARAASGLDFHSKLTGIAQTSIGQSISQRERDGRQVLLERIMNHKFTIGSDRKVTLERDGYKVFTDAREHQSWLFSQGVYDIDGSKEGGLRLYKEPYKNTTGRERGVTGAEGDHNEEGINLEVNQKKDVRVAKEKLSEDIDAFWSGSAPDEHYNYDDLYGLVRLKLQHTCDHCTTDSAGASLNFFKSLSGDETYANAEVQATKLADGKYSVKVKDVIEYLFDDRNAPAWEPFLEHIENVVTGADQHSVSIDEEEAKNIYQSGSKSTDEFGAAVSSHGDY